MLRWKETETWTKEGESQGTEDRGEVRGGKEVVAEYKNEEEGKRQKGTQTQDKVEVEEGEWNRSGMNAAEKRKKKPEQGDRKWMIYSDMNDDDQKIGKE